MNERMNDGGRKEKQEMEDEQEEAEGNFIIMCMHANAANTSATPSFSNM
jgi:hypothetical protein